MKNRNLETQERIKQLQDCLGHVLAIDTNGNPMILGRCRLSEEMYPSNFTDGKPILGFNKSLDSITFFDKNTWQKG